MNDSTFAHGEFCWTELGSRDVAGCKAFYSAVAGWDSRDDPIPSGEGLYTSFTAGGGDVAGGYEMVGEHFDGVPAHWLSYIHVDDVDATVERVKDLGGNVVQEAMDIPGICRIAVVQDPLGATFGLFQPKGHPGAARLGMGPGAFSWYEVVTPSAEQAGSFYQQLFGWTSQAQDMGGFDYTTFSRGDASHCGMMQMDGPEWEGIPPHWMPYLTVSDVDSAVAAGTANGGEVRIPATPIPGVGRFAMLVDPGGAVFSVIEYDMEATGAAS